MMLINGSRGKQGRREVAGKMCGLSSGCTSGHVAGTAG